MELSLQSISDTQCYSFKVSHSLKISIFIGQTHLAAITHSIMNSRNPDCSHWNPLSLTRSTLWHQIIHSNSEMGARGHTGSLRQQNLPLEINRDSLIFLFNTKETFAFNLFLKPRWFFGFFCLVFCSPMRSPKYTISLLNQHLMNAYCVPDNR